MLPFITKRINNPWGQYELSQWQANGSQRDSVIYNPQINARFIAEDKHTYSACIKVKGEEYKNFWLVPISRTSFLFIAYVPQLEFLNELAKIQVVKQILPKFPFLSSIYIKQDNSDGYKLDEETRICSSAIILKVDESLDDLIFPWRGYVDNEEIISSYAKLNAIYSKIVAQIEKLYKIVEEVNQREIEEIEARQKQVLKKTLIKTGVKLAALCIAPYAVAAIDGIDILVDGMDIFDMNMSDFSYLNFDDKLLDLGDNFDVITDNPNYSSELTIDDSSSNMIGTAECDYNVPFQGSDKEITVHQEGNSSRTEKVTAKKVAGTSNQWDIYKGNTYITTLQGILHGKFYLPGFGKVIF